MLLSSNIYKWKIQPYGKHWLMTRADRCSIASELDRLRRESFASGSRISTDVRS